VASASQQERARAFHRLHEGDGLLVLPNAWDAGSARIFELAGFEAIGTSSAGVAFAAGRPDGGLSRDEMVAAVARIAAAVEVPVSADIEAGYGDSAAAVGETVAAAIEAGAIGINIEDAVAGEERALVEPAEQCARIEAARGAAEDAAVELFVNARTDVFWLGLEGEELLETAIDRLRAFADAGADGAFVPRLVDADQIRRVAGAVPVPLNVLAAPGMPAPDELLRLGAKRLSVGSGPARSAMALTRRIADELHTEGVSVAMGESTIGYQQANELLSKEN
jgi:2-methylisocitrate lyase-like PEP mutase family enzyme